MSHDASPRSPQPVPLVRRATPQDVPDLAALAALTFPLACPPGSTPADQQEFVTRVLSPAAFETYLADPARTVLVAQGPTDGPALVGYTMLVGGDPTDPDVRAALTVTPTVELSKCYVDPAAHGSGVADALMAASLADGRARGAAAMWLGVNQLNERAQRFYGRHGFVRVGTKRFRVGARLEHDFVLERAL